MLPKLFLLIEIMGALTVLAGMVVIPFGIGLFSPAIGVIWSGIELLLLGVGLLWVANPELSARKRRR